MEANPFNQYTYGNNKQRSGFKNPVFSNHRNTSQSSLETPIKNFNIFTENINCEGMCIYFLYYESFGLLVCIAQCLPFAEKEAKI
jgi:hypothetical protein